MHLQPFPDCLNFHQPFSIFNTNITRDVLLWNNKLLNTNDYIYLTNAITPLPKTLANFKIIQVENNLPDSFFYYNAYEDDVLIWIKKKLFEKESIVPKTAVFKSDAFKHNVLIVANEHKPESLSLCLNDAYYKNVLLNMVAMLPGKSRPNEVVIFSAHYDHLGAKAKDSGDNGDNIYNGANDNAAGVAALLSLAQYYATQNNNERTIIFCAFAGEELGLVGSKLFVDDINTKAVKAVINMDMIGIPQMGKNHIFITGSWNSTFSKIFRKNLSTLGSNVIVDRDRSVDLFKRSDNYSFFQKGIAAYTIMSSTDQDDCYHQPCDEVKRLDIQHIATIIKSIVQGCSTIVSGGSTP